MDSNLECLGKMIRERRKEKRISIEDISRECGVCKDMVLKWENGKREPKGITLIRIMKKLGLSKKQLFQII